MQSKAHFIAKTSELRQGDIVVSHGLRLLIDQEILVSKSHPVASDGSQCRYTKALVLNRDDVPSEVVPVSWTADWDRTQSWEARPHNGEHRWSIQGNDLAYWWVEGAQVNRVSSMRADGTLYHHDPREVVAR